VSVTDERTHKSSGNVSDSGNWSTQRKKNCRSATCPPPVKTHLTGMESCHTQTGHQLNTYVTAQPPYTFHKHISIMGNSHKYQEPTGWFSLNICSTLHMLNRRILVDSPEHLHTLPKTGLGLTYAEESLNSVAAYNY